MMNREIEKEGNTQPSPNSLGEPPKILSTAQIPAHCYISHNSQQEMHGLHTFPRTRMRKKKAFTFTPLVVQHSHHNANTISCLPRHPFVGLGLVAWAVTRWLPAAAKHEPSSTRVFLGSMRNVWQAWSPEGESHGRAHKPSTHHVDTKDFTLHTIELDDGVPRDPSRLSRVQAQFQTQGLNKSECRAIIRVSGASHTNSRPISRQYYSGRSWPIEQRVSDSSIVQSCGHRGSST